VQKNLPSVFRALGRSTGFRKAVIGSLREVDVRTPGGLYLGKAGTFDVDLSRLSRVVERIVRGLYSIETGAPLPPDAVVGAYADDGLRDIDSSLFRKLAEHLVVPTLAGKTRVIGRGVFKYWFSLAEDAPHTSSWVLLFYDTVPFIALTLNGEAMRQAGQAQSPPA
jgi:hypothetical protein